MATTQKLELKQSQSLSLTPQLRQAISLLQMTNAELQEFLETEVEKNPLIDLSHSKSFESFGASPYTGSDDPYDQTEHIKPLREYLAEQIRQQEKCETTANLACYLVDELDDEGFLIDPNFELSDRYNVASADLEKAIAALQRCDPIGIGARGIKECLQLQLIDQGYVSAAFKVAITHLTELANGKIKAVAKKTNIRIKELEDAFFIIRQLNPRPASGYVEERNIDTLPDVLVTKTDDDGWRVELNPAALPKIIVNEEYAAEIARDGKEAKQFVQKLRGDARFLAKAVDTRAKTLLSVATYIVTVQSTYFKTGVMGLKPLKLADVAAHTGVSISTVSRVTRGKYMLSPYGMRELRFFLSGGVKRDKDDSGLATAAIQDQIAKLIAQESVEKPLADVTIAKMLASKGIKISRRTVAKYRLNLGIKSSNQRLKSMQ